MTDDLKGVSLADALATAHMEYASAELEADVVFAWFRANRDTLRLTRKYPITKAEFDALLGAAERIGLPPDPRKNSAGGLYDPRDQAILGGDPSL